jgi:hypothetical protein
VRLRRSLLVLLASLTLALAPSAAAYVYTDGMYYEHLAFKVSTAQYRTLLLKNCVPQDSTWKYWACPEAPPSRYL